MRRTLAVLLLALLTGCGGGDADTPADPTPEATPEATPEPTPEPTPEASDVDASDVAGGSDLARAADLGAAETRAARRPPCDGSNRPTASLTASIDAPAS